MQFVHFWLKNMNLSFVCRERPTKIRPSNRKVQYFSVGYISKCLGGRSCDRSCECPHTNTVSSTKSGASRYLGSTVGQCCCNTSPPWSSGLKGCFTWQRPTRGTEQNTNDKHLKKTNSTSQATLSFFLWYSPLVHLLVFPRNVLIKCKRLLLLSLQALLWI